MDKHQPTASNHSPVNKSDGKYYCPMYCEGDKTYNKSRQSSGMRNVFGKNAA